MSSSFSFSSATERRLAAHRGGAAGEAKLVRMVVIVIAIDGGALLVVKCKLKPRS